MLSKENRSRRKIRSDMIYINKDNVENIKKYNSKIITINIIKNEFYVNPYANYLVYILDNNIVGYIYYSDIYERSEINMFEVDKNYRNKKIGNILLKELTEKLKKTITLEVNENNKIAIHLYEKYGFTKVAKREGYYNGVDGILCIRKYPLN